ncbi:MAG: 3'-5' exonuclease [Odoribacter sp.]
MVDEMVTDLKKNINKEEIDRLPLFVFTGEVIVIEDPEHAAQAARFLRENSFVGFDTETRPAFHKGERYKVGLLQLATRDQVYLFRLNKCGFGKELRDLLSDPVVVKIGVGIRDDLRNLRKSGEFTPASFVDMQEYAARFGIEDKSFSKLMAIIFGVRISKKQRVSNWEALVLTEAQIRYAATDAWGALKMYERLSSEA